MPLAITITLERSGVWRGSTGSGKRRREPNEPGRFSRPVRLSMPQGSVLARPSRLPLPNASAQCVEYFGVLEYIRNDDLAIDDVARVLAPGGTLRLRVPATGPLAALDAYNLMHYLVDTSRRGFRPHETSEVGWRRHYGVDDLLRMLGPDRFRIVRVRRRGLALAEVIDVAAMVAFRWLRPNPVRYESGKRLAQTVERLERRLIFPFGAVLDVDAVRLPE